MAIISKILIHLGMKLLTSDAILELLLFTVEKGAKSSKVVWDDELVEIIKKHLKAKE
jgi:hypothetical protein